MTAYQMQYFWLTKGRKSVLRPHTVKTTQPTMKMENVTKMLGMVATIAAGIIIADLVKTKLMK